MTVQETILNILRKEGNLEFSVLYSKIKPLFQNYNIYLGYKSPIRNSQLRAALFPLRTAKLVKYKDNTDIIELIE